MTTDQLLTSLTTFALWLGLALGGLYVIGNVDLGAFFKTSGKKAVFCVFVFLLVVFVVIRVFR